MNLRELHHQYPVIPEYLSNLYFIERDQGREPNAMLAERLGVSRPAVTQVVGRLKRLKFVNQNKYSTVSLTPSGRMLAKQIILRHFLLEHMMVSLLNFPWDKCDEEAGQLQTFLSDDFTEHLNSFLGYPQTCPHGNPMPDADCEKKYLRAPRLHEANKGDDIQIIRITEKGETTPGMLSFCQSNEIKPGRTFRLKEHNSLGVVVTSLDQKNDVEIPMLFVSCICFEPKG